MARSVLITNPGDAGDIPSPIMVEGFVSPHDQTVTVSLYRPGASTPTATTMPITPAADGRWTTSVATSADGEYLLIAQQTGFPITHSVSITVSVVSFVAENSPSRAMKKKPAPKKKKPAKKVLKAKGKKR